MHTCDPTCVNIMTLYTNTCDTPHVLTCTHLYRPATHGLFSDLHTHVCNLFCMATLPVHHPHSLACPPPPDDPALPLQTPTRLYTRCMHVTCVLHTCVLSPHWSPPICLPCTRLSPGHISSPSPLTVVGPPSNSAEVGIAVVEQEFMLRAVYMAQQQGHQVTPVNHPGGWVVSCGGLNTKRARSDGMGQDVGRAESVEVWSAWAKISHGQSLGWSVAWLSGCGLDKDSKWAGFSLRVGR